VSISKLELEVKRYTRKDGGRFPVNRFLRSNALVETFQALWCELDKGSPKEQHDRLRAFGVFPTMIVRSGGKSRHAYWVLAEPVTRDRFNQVMPRLCAQLLGDGKTIPAMHQLRLSGSIHSKSLERGSLRRARLIHDEEWFPTIEEIEAALTLTPEQVTAYMDRELGRKPRNRAGSGSGAEETNGKSTCGDGNRAEPRHTAGIEELELRAFEDGSDDAILDAAHRVACSQGLTREGRRMAFRSFKLLLSTGFVVQVEQYLPEKRTRLYDISIPILSPDVWRRHCHETTAEWAAHAARRAAQDADADGLHGVLPQRRRSSEQA
jgi:hypothetical protein